MPENGRRDLIRRLKFNRHMLVPLLYTNYLLLYLFETFFALLHILCTTKKAVSYTRYSGPKFRR